MTMIIEWIGASLRDHPELALFLALATGYLLVEFAWARSSWGRLWDAC